MGGQPRFSLLTLGIPAEFGEDFWDAFFEGYFALAERVGISLIGGDTSASPETTRLDSIVIGSCTRGQAVRRSGALPGDDIWVTGTIGASHVGLKLLLAGERVIEGEESAPQRAMRRHLCPEPPIEFGKLIGESGLAHSMIDISDGLAQDLEQICESSGVSAEIDRDLVPIAEEMQLIAFDSREQLSLAISGGEDYELLFAAASNDRDRVRRIADQAEVGVAAIGKIIERSESKVYLVQEGDRYPLTLSGYEHFS
jgi:thiamine-monophosphate kinase